MTTIMIIEDEPEMITLAEFVFARRGFKVVGASASEEAIKKTQEVNPDLILLDIMMPDMDGLEFYTRIRQIDSLKATPVFVVTAYAENSESNYHSWIGRGAADYMVKPFTPNEMLSRVDAILEDS